ncbi:LysM peptidoglycan-binding domain-containing protein [Planococcus lenghuensis]|uniref:S-layer protein n=1 Tax=Planococcus lenghuensis TaxID=2213202 RepID=A0A1Q2L2Z3_9BACL|nr:LysM peptidoglycan-binding domain-containing protein [Planococcus lenghuensis]AQQ54252.1 hypothetical protein B0X71_14870 [Planococcus lenghuensis]
MKKWVFALAIVFGAAIPAAVAEDGPFRDVPANFWAADAIYELEDAEVIGETPDKTYNPHKAIERDEAIQILANALNLELGKFDSSAVPEFLDLQPGDLAYEEAIALVEQGILTNTEALNPNETLTRSEAAELLVKAFDLQLSEETPVFKDVPGPHWAHEYTQIVAGLGILEGSTADTFEPDKGISRAYFAVIIDRALDYAASLANESTKDKQVETAEEESSAPAEEQSAVPTGTYTVKSGDALYDIALNAGVSVDELKQWNNLQSNIIDIGQELKVPSSFEPAEETQPSDEEPAIEEPPAPAEEQSAAPAGAYTVKSGDTLYSIALDAGVSVDELKQWNNLQSNIIDIGEELKVPSSFDPAEETVTKETPAKETPVKETSAKEEPAEEAAPAEESQPIISGEEGLSADEQRSIELVNLERSKTGASPVIADEKLNRIAQVKAEDMAANHYFDHTSPTYGSPFEMAYNFGYSYQMYGENLAIGYTTPGAAMTGWMNSDSHRTNLLNPGYTQMGVGHAVDEAGTDYWVHLFSRQ